MKKRAGLVAEFQDDAGPPFFVLSIKAGGTGLNLTAASHVVHFDRWWNPAVENQATDRAYRIGQKKNVLVHKFVCRGTIEEKIDALIEQKRGLSDEILAGGGGGVADRAVERRAAADGVARPAQRGGRIEGADERRRRARASITGDIPPTSGWPSAPPERRKQVKALEKKGQKLSPVVLAGRDIAGTFWGKAWCENLESYSDYANRLPRGRSYVRSGAVIDLQIEPGRLVARVQGSSLYTVTIGIGPVEPARWKTIVGACSGKIDSVVELLQGKLSKAVMEVISGKETGLFPAPRQIQLRCSCPDSATMCKHVAAVLYGVGARLDTQPDLLFRLRGADPTELIVTAAKGAALGGPAPAKEKRLGETSPACSASISIRGPSLRRLRP